MPLNYIVVAPTFYTSTTDDTRYSLALQTCREAARCGVRLILVDGSPSNAEVRAGLQQAGGSFVKILAQRMPGKKGVALREAIQAAVEELTSSASNDDDDQNGVVAFQEPEKVSMIAQWKDVVAHMERTESEVCVPARADALFQETYPIEQYHQEKFVNLYLDSVAKTATGGKLPSIDWTMGPMALRRDRAHHWLDFDGTLWDAQLVPMVRAARWHAAQVTSFQVKYRHPVEMKRDEEGSPQWSEKRLLQTNLLFDIVGGALNATQEK